MGRNAGVKVVSGHSDSVKVAMILPLKKGHDEL